MISPDGEYILCESQPDCDSKIKNHAWGQIKSEGWFFTKPKDGEPSKAYCPAHHPDWVKTWRSKRKKA